MQFPPPCHGGERRSGGFDPSPSTLACGVLWSFLFRAPSSRNTRRSSTASRSLAGKAARLQPTRWRPFSASFAGAQHFFTNKWFVPRGGVAGGCMASPEA
jgi:hypothetical protein